MTLVCSTAHTFHYKWFVQLVNIHSNQRLDLRQDMVSHLTHSTQEQLLPVLKVQSQLLRTPTSTTEELKLQTLCNNKKLNETREGFITPLFFDINNSMSSITRQPTQLDYASPTQFKFGIAQLPKVEFFTTNANLPGINHYGGLNISYTI